MKQSLPMIFFSAVTVLVEPSNAKDNEWNNVYLVPVGCFVLYNFGDCVGKYLGAQIQWPRTSKSHQAILLTAAILRIVFIPLIMYCNVSPQERNTEVGSDPPGPGQ